MDPHTWQSSHAENEEELVHGDFFASYSQSQYLASDLTHDLELSVMDIPFFELSPDSQSYVPSSIENYEAESADVQDSNGVLKILNLILAEDMDERPDMFHDPLALQATEKSLYEVIGHKYPPTGGSLDQPTDFSESIMGSSSEHTSGSSDGTTSLDSQLIMDPGEFTSTLKQDYQQGFSSNLFVQEHPQPLSIPMKVSESHTDTNILLNSLDSRTLVRNMFSNSESILQFKKGMEDGNKFLPLNNQLIIDLDKYTLPHKSEDIKPVGALKQQKDQVNDSVSLPRGKRHAYPGDDAENLERVRKQSATYDEDVDLSEYFDRVLFCNDAKVSEFCGVGAKSSDVQKSSSQGVLTSGSSRRSRTKKSGSDGDTADIWNLLISCAQSVATDDYKTANERLKQIYQFLALDGVSHKILAHVFATGLRARLEGTGATLYASLTLRKMTASEKIRAYKVYLCSCPFKKLPIFFANEMIKIAAAEASTLHIVDFGILYGFQWPVLIQHLSERPGGPPKLRITGIELPQRGFKPAERLEETGARLKKYCERFGVPFEYQAIATQNFEAIKLEDLRIVRDEVLCVNCLFRLGRLLDESVVSDSPRDKLLRLIRKMKPDMFVNSVTNGSYSAPIFLTRFKEALFYYSMMFDMLGTILPNGNPQLTDFMQEYFGREVLNVVACEGVERVERPETYKKWHSRHLNAGFKPHTLNEETLRKLRSKSTATSHKDFVFDRDGNWMLQGWKGRILSASSCWVPA